MKQTLIVIAFAFVVVLLCMAGLGIKILVKKNGEFKRHCNAVDPHTGQRSGCQCAAKSVLDDCHHGPKFHPLEVNKELLEECGTLPQRKPKPANR